MEEIEVFSFPFEKIKGLTISEKEALSKKIREEIIFDVTKNGGHLSSNLGVVELTIELLSQFDINKDTILFDVSHQTYTYKILTNRNLSLLRIKGGISGFSNIEESKYDPYTGGHSGSALSIGLGISTAKKLANDLSKTIVVVGDASIVNGVSFEAINNLDNPNYGKLLVILNDNNMSISSPKGKISSLLSSIRASSSYQIKAERFNQLFNNDRFRWIYKFFRKIKNVIKRAFIGENIFETLGFTYLGPIDGHNFKNLSFFINRAKNIDKNILLHVKTIKGKSLKEAEEDTNGYFHGINGSINKVSTDLVSTSSIASKAIYDLLKKDDKTILITPAMILGGKLEKCFEDFPTRCFDTGISEEHSIDLACGFALKGYHPILEIYSCFLQRDFDQLLNDVSQMNLPILIIVERAGLVGQDGPSHQGIFDVNMELALKESIIYQPTNINSIYQSIFKCEFNYKMPIFIRLEKEYLEKEEIDYNYRLLSYLEDFIKGKKICVITVGFQGEKLADKLLKNNIEVNIIRLYCLHFKKNIESHLIEELLKQEEIILYDPTSTAFSIYLSATLLKYGYNKRFISYSLENEFVKAMSKKEQLEELKLDVFSVYEEILKRL